MSFGMLIQACGSASVSSLTRLDSVSAAMKDAGAARFTITLLAHFSSASGQPKSVTAVSASGIFDFATQQGYADITGGKTGSGTPRSYSAVFTPSVYYLGNFPNPSGLPSGTKWIEFPLSHLSLLQKCAPQLFYQEGALNPYWYVIQLSSSVAKILSDANVTISGTPAEKLSLLTNLNKFKGTTGSAEEKFELATVGASTFPTVVWLDSSNRILRFNQILYVSPKSVTGRAKGGPNEMLLTMDFSNFGTKLNLTPPNSGILNIENYLRQQASASKEETSGKESPAVEANECPGQS